MLIAGDPAEFVNKTRNLTFTEEKAGGLK